MTNQQLDFITAAIANLTRDMQKSHATNEIILSILADKFELNKDQLKLEIGKIEAELIFASEVVWNKTAEAVRKEFDDQH